MKSHARWFRPTLEQVEARQLPSTILLIADLISLQLATQQRIERNLADLRLQSGPFTSAPVNGTLPDGQPNQVIDPTGVPTARESRRETFHASFVGQYTVGPGRFSTESSDFLFRGAGRTSTVLHDDIQLRLINPTDPTAVSTGGAALFDRNIDSNSDLGLDVYAVPEDVDQYGRPTELTIYSLDPNISSGNYVEGLAQGTIQIHYGPVPRTKYFASSSRPVKNALSQGTARMVINAQVYGSQIAFALRNVSYNP